MRHTAGDVWRVKGDNGAADTAPLGSFDEIVVGEREHDSWIHVEMMDDRSAFVQVCDRVFWVYVPSKGSPRIVGEEQRDWKPFKQCRKRPGGRRCSLAIRHPGACWVAANR